MSEEKIQILCSQCVHRTICKFNNKDLSVALEEANKVLESYAPLMLSVCCQEFDLDPSTQTGDLNF